MSPEQVVDLFREVLTCVIMMVSAIILPGLIIGLVISVLQAATQINEQTLSFIPRLLITLFTLAALSPWLLQKMITVTNIAVDAMPGMVS